MEVEEKEANRIRIPRARQGRFVSVCVVGGEGRGWGGQGGRAGWWPDVSWGGHEVKTSTAKSSRPH